MRQYLFIWYFFFVLSTLLGCTTADSQNTGSPNNEIADSMRADTTNQLVLKESTLKSFAGDLIQLQKGEWYCRAKFANHDKTRGMLIFEQEDGNIREIVSNPWNRSGNMQLSANKDIRLSRDQYYELIYFYQFETPDLENSRASGFYISEIITMGGYFNSDNRYVVQKETINYRFAPQSKGKFLDDLEGGILLIEDNNGKPEIQYSATYSGEKFRLNCDFFLPEVLKTALPGSDTDVFLKFKDGEWVYADSEGKRRVFRAEKN